MTLSPRKSALQTLSDGGSPREKLSGRRRNIIEQLQQNLSKWPPAVDARMALTRDRDDIQVVADIDMDIFLEGECSASKARIAICWWTHPDSIGDRFRFHYIEPEDGFNAGWHRQESEHVEGLDHFQYQFAADSKPEYKPIEFAQDAPVGILWQVLGEKLPHRIHQRIEGDLD